MKNIIFLLLGLFWMVSVTAQDNSGSLSLQVKKGRIFTADGYKITFTSLTGNSDNFSFKKSEANAFTELSTAKVLRIQQETGNEAGKWAAIVGASGLVGSLLGVAQANRELSGLGVEKNNSATVPIVVGLTALSAGIGALIGMNKKKYRTVWENPKNATGFRMPQMNVQMTGYAGIGLDLRWRI